MAKTVAKTISTTKSTTGISSARNGGSDYRTVSGNSTMVEYVGVVITSDGYSSASYISGVSCSWQQRATNSTNNGTIVGNSCYVQGTLIIGSISAGKPFFTDTGNDLNNITTSYANGNQNKNNCERYSTTWKTYTSSWSGTLGANDAKLGIGFILGNTSSTGARVWVNDCKVSYTLNVRNYVTFTGDGVTQRTDTLNHGDTPSYGSTPSRSGYRFTGWKSNRNNTVYTGTLPTADGYDTTYTAQWVQQFYLDVNGRLDGTDTGSLSGFGTCDVYIGGSLASNDCTDYWTQHDTGTSYEIKDIKANSGYQYIGSVGDALSGTLNAAKNVRLEFKTVYTVSLTAGTGGTVSGGGSYVYGSSITISATPNSGYKFVKWSDDNTSASRTITITGNVSLTATFEVDIITISFDSRGGSAVASVTYQPNSTFGTLPIPTRAGYEFVGWFYDAPCYDGGTFEGSDFAVVPRTYMYTDNITVWIQAYRNDWSTFTGAQIISCTEGGGWGVGYQANTTGHGTEIYVDGVGYRGIDFNYNSLSSGWHTFCFTFASGTYTGYVDGVSVGTVNTGGSAIKYHGSNAIFVGAEAGSSASTPAGAYFTGDISSAIITNSSTVPVAITSSTPVGTSHTYYAVWRPENVKGFYVGTQKARVYVGSTLVKQIYRGSTRIV